MTRTNFIVKIIFVTLIDKLDQSSFIRKHHFYVCIRYYYFNYFLIKVENLKFENASELHMMLKHDMNLN